MNQSKHEMRLIAKMRGIKVKKSTSKTKLFRILKRKDKITYNESPFKSIIADIRSELSKKGYKLIKNGLKYAEEMKKSTNSQVKSFKENLIKFKNDLIMKNKINNRIRKYLDGYYGKNKFKGVKDIWYLFNEEEDDSANEDIKYLFNESLFKSIITDIRSNLSKRGHKLIKNGLKYAEEMKDLTYSQVKSFKEKLIKFNNDLIKKNKIKEDFDDYYEKHKIKAVKYVKYLSDDFVYEDIRCFFNETNDTESNEVLSNEIKSYEAKPYEVEYYENRSNEIKFYETDYIDIKPHQIKSNEIGYIDIKPIEIKSYVNLMKISV